MSDFKIKWQSFVSALGRGAAAVKGGYIALRARCSAYPVSTGACMAAVSVLFELLFQCWIADKLTLKGLLVPLLMAACLGLVLGTLTELLPGKKAKKITAVCVMTVLATVYLVEFFVQDAYHMFMTPVMMLHGAKGVATDYADIVASLLLRDSWRILLMLLPGILFALLAEPKVRTKQRLFRIARTAANSVLLVIAVSALVFGSLSPMKVSHDFEGGIRKLGIPYAIGQSLATDVFGVEEELSFTVPEPPVSYTPPTQPPATVPAEPAPTEEGAGEEITEPTEPPKVYEPNVLPIDYAGLAAAHKDPEINSYIAAAKPSMQNDYTGIFKGKNLILITAEAFTKAVIDPELTPTLYRLYHEGITFTEFYQPAWGGSTTGGEMSNLFGLVPDCSGGMLQMSVQRPCITMGYQLTKLGYWSAAYHNNTGSFYDRNTTHVNLGYDRFITPDNGMKVKGCWPQSDLEMFQDTLPQYIDKQPFNIYYMSVSGHSTYVYEENAMTRKNYDLVKDLPYSEPVKCYLAANLELEHALTYLVEELEKAGIADDTVIAISPDHYPYGLDASRTWGNSKNCVAELFGVDEADYNNIVRDQSAMIIWSGCLEGKGITVDSPTFSLDLLPTLSNLFGVPFESRLFSGRDALSDAEALVFWPNYSWVTDMGTYVAATETFTPREGVTVDDGYVAYITSVVKSKIGFAYAVQRQNYIRTLGKLLAAEENPQ